MKSNFYVLIWQGVIPSTMPDMSAGRFESEAECRQWASKRNNSEEWMNPKRVVCKKFKSAYAAMVFMDSQRERSLGEYSDLVVKNPGSFK